MGSAILAVITAAQSLCVLSDSRVCGMGAGVSVLHLCVSSHQRSYSEQAAVTSVRHGHCALTAPVCAVCCVSGQ